MDSFDFSSFKNFYILESDRIESYKLWPFDDSMPCNKIKMAEAGFYWTGSEKEMDLTTCFACGKVLNEWEANDDPWMEHAKHAPQCAFVKVRKSESELTVEEFIDLIGSTVKNMINKKRTLYMNKLEIIIAEQRNQFLKKFDLL